LDALHPDTRLWWDDGLAGEHGDDRPWSADAACLAGFLREEVAARRAALRRRTDPCAPSRVGRGGGRGAPARAGLARSVTFQRTVCAVWWINRSVKPARLFRGRKSPFSFAVKAAKRTLLQMAIGGYHHALLSAPRETLGVEHRSWLEVGNDKNHDKTLVALANHGGGRAFENVRLGRRLAARSNGCE
jgi:hypothetical protein